MSDPGQPGGGRQRMALGGRGGEPRHSIRHRSVPIRPPPARAVGNRGLSGAARRLSAEATGNRSRSKRGSVR